jgi:hypothetical protein
MMLTRFKSIHNLCISHTEFNESKIIKRGKLKMGSFDTSCGVHKGNLRQAEAVILVVCNPSMNEP